MQFSPLCSDPGHFFIPDAFDIGMGEGLLRKPVHKPFKAAFLRVMKRPVQPQCRPARTGIGDIPG